MSQKTEKTNVTKFKSDRFPEELEYDICVSVYFLNQIKEPVEKIYSEYIYLGTGYVSVVDGKPYNGKTLCHFWKYK